MASRTDDIESVKRTFEPLDRRRALVSALDAAYADSGQRAASYGPWRSGQYNVPHDRRGLVDGYLERVVDEIQGARVVTIDNRVGSHSFFGLQIGNILMMPGRTKRPGSPPRDAQVRYRLTADPQLSYLERQTHGYDFNEGLPLLVYLSHGAAKGIPSQLAWAEILLPDEHRRIAFSMNLLGVSEPLAAPAFPPTPIVDPVRPTLRNPDLRRETGA